MVRPRQIMMLCEGQPLTSALLLQDFHGQKLSEYLYYYIIIICGAIGWIAGYFKESFLLTFYGWCVGVVLSLIVSGVVSGRCIL